MIISAECKYNRLISYDVLSESIQEACNSANNSISQILAEMNMNIVLQEMDRDKSLTTTNNLYNASFEEIKSNKIGIKEKISNIIDKIANQIAKLWDKLIFWIKEKVEAYKRINYVIKFASKINDELENNIQAFFDDRRNHKIKYKFKDDKYVTFEGIKKLNTVALKMNIDMVQNGVKISDNLSNENVKEKVQAVFNKLDIVKTGDQYVNPSNFNSALVIVMDADKTSSSTFKQILAMKATINDKIRNLKSDIKRIEQDPDSRAETLKKNKFNFYDV